MLLAEPGRAALRIMAKLTPNCHVHLENPP